MASLYKFYAEIINPTNSEVLWHYYVNCPTKEDAKEFARTQFIKEHSNDLLLDTGGLFMVTVEETE
jgi:hypothetical protein